MMQNEQQQQSNLLFGYTCASIACLCVIDIVLNATTEYGDFVGDTASSNVSVVTIVQVLLQIFVLVHVFALLGATFLFRSGLFGLLYKRFRSVLWMQPAYILLSIVLGTVRSHQLESKTELLDIWDADEYVALSILHKLGAVCCYCCTIHAMEELRKPKFYSHHYWMRR